MNETNSSALPLNAPADEPLMAFFVLIVMGLIVLTIALLLRYCMETEDDGTRPAEDRAERERKRKEYIRRTLKTHTWGDTTKHVEYDASCSNVVLDIPDGSDDNLKDKERSVDDLSLTEVSLEDPVSSSTATNTTSLESTTYVGGLECAICLSNFDANDVVCESNNLRCKHLFHQECIEPWLIRHEHCPVCRELYLLSSIQAAKQSHEPSVCHSCGATR